MSATSENTRSPVNSTQKIPNVNIDEDPEFTPQEQRKIIHRVDRRLIVILGVLHTVSLIDRGNIGGAAVAGMNEELKLVGTQYLCAGFVTHWSQMVGIRIIIGALEAGFFPATLYLISTWYTRFDIHKRFAIFYLLGCVAAAFTGLLSFGITHMRGLGGLSAWRWIFVIQGLLTCVLAAISYFVLVDFPDRMAESKRKFMKKNEYALILRRIEKDRADVTVEPFNLRKYLTAGLDLNILGFGLIYFSTTTTAYAITFFLPLIYREGMGFSQGASLCLFAPPYAAAGILMYATSWIGDKYRIRGPIIIFNGLLTLAGLPLMVSNVAFIRLSTISKETRLGVREKQRCPAGRLFSHHYGR
ncbi:uncharacterized protein LDX57_011563 [Aspergillus melleus]|uniref:uncharacterized protein n=1 Tax=Aspergillus melleus TaxID=138277 RepID=UPI001E8DB490|nr:uncharacterized protein LDX57_011563 [Aspergillus melleus]KAH8433927.1 hypothetical protein LDX57_011563 [Aspergillus melleus]